MSEYHKRLKSEIRKLKLETLTLRKINAEWQADLDEQSKMEALQNKVDYAIENGGI